MNKKNTVHKHRVKQHKRTQAWNNTNTQKTREWEQMLLIRRAGISCPIYRRVEDTKGVIRIRKSKDRQHNDQKKKDKRPSNDLQNITHKTKD